jgi:hypothetical protein
MGSNESSTTHVQPAGPTLADPAHPANPMFRDALEGVEKLGPVLGHPSGQSHAQLAGALTATALSAGLTRIDSVIHDEEASRLFAVQGELHSPHKQVAGIDVHRGLHTSVEESTQGVEEHVLQEVQRKTQRHAERVLFHEEMKELRQAEHLPPGPPKHPGHPGG